MSTKPEDVLTDRTRPFNGKEYLESLRDGREVYIYGERVKDVTTHPAFRNAAASIAQLYDALHADKTKAVLTAPTDTGSGGYTHKIFKVAHSREDVIRRQQDELLELSTPVVKLWEGVLAVPMIGTLDSSRTQLVMESLLTRIVETGSELAIIDITGVPTVDTLVAQHLLKTVTAIRLMGADCIISGIRPQIAQTIVHLGVDLSAVTTKASLADAFQVALTRAGMTIVRKC